jgi:hypothetical protein
MKHKTLFCLMVVAAAFAGNAEAIYKCTTAKGVVYQDRPCREGAETDVQIVIPTGEIAPKSIASQDDQPQANSAPGESRIGAPKPGHASADNPVSVTKPADKRSNQTAANAADDPRKQDVRSVVDNSSVPMTAEQARKAEATAKYFTTDGTASGSETPEHMTCESPSGEKRRFILTNGKMTSI